MGGVRMGHGLMAHWMHCYIFILHRGLLTSFVVRCYVSCMHAMHQYDFNMMARHKIRVVRVILCLKRAFGTGSHGVMIALCISLTCTHS
jgi:hypothetical protein